MYVTKLISSTMIAKQLHYNSLAIIYVLKNRNDRMIMIKMHMQGLHKQ